MKHALSILRVRGGARTNSVKGFPFASELVTDVKGRVSRVMMSVRDYQILMEAVEDEGMYRAIRQVRHERPLSINAARKRLASE